LSQVFHNLVLNAVQAMPRGGTVTLVFRRSSPNRISIAVVDEGTGIPAEDIPRIFDPYFTTKPKGTGLGLSVVHAVVDRHGGTLDIDSRLGRGTVFTVHLTAAPGLPESVTDESDPSLPSLHGQRVLLMEDESDLRELMVQVLASLGLEPYACRNGRDALVAFDAAQAVGRPFSLVVSDLLVPGDMGGREMISLLRSRAGQSRALAVTGFSTERSAEDFHNQGFDVIVGKPFTVNELKTRVVELMKSPWKTAPST
jgi:CheY-like chemotaxis protein/anti-sigma regulatory factor (Ser/Thr protein kinase)